MPLVAAAAVIALMRLAQFGEALMGALAVIWVMRLVVRRSA